MAVFIELVTAPTNDAADRIIDDARIWGRAGLSSVRRPLRGIEVKEDTHALIRAIKSDGSEIPLFDSGSSTGKSPYFTNFILQTVQEARMEKHQILETFGESFLYFSGEAPRFLDVTAVLLNTHDFNWKAEFLENYDKYLRGSRLTELGACCYLFYDDNIVEGYILQTQVVDQADNPALCTMQFRMFLVKYNNISFVGDPYFPIRPTVQFPEGTSVGDLTTTLNSEQINLLVSEGVGISGKVVNGQFISSASLERDVPLRGKISANTDEWTGEPFLSRSQFSEEQLVSSTIPVWELNQIVADVISMHGVDSALAGSPAMMQELGLGPVFLPSGVDAGFGSFGQAGATFNATAQGGYSFSSGFQASAGASASASAGASAGFSSGVSTGGMGANAGMNAGASYGFGASAGVGVGASYAYSSGAGASVDVGGVPSAFGMTVVSGTMASGASAYAQAVAAASGGWSI